MFAVDSLRQSIAERLAAAAEDILGVFEVTISGYEQEVKRQRELLDSVLKPEIRLRRTELAQQHVCNEEGRPAADQQLCNRERDEEEPPQIKEKQEELCTSLKGEQLALKQQEEDFFKSDPTCENSEASTQIFTCDQSHSAAEEEPPDNNATKRVGSESESFGVSEPNNGHRIRFQRGDHGKAAKPKIKERGTSTSTRDIKPKLKKEQNNQEHRRGGNTESISNPQPMQNAKKCSGSYTQFKGHTTHTAAKPFSCRVCGKGFRFKRYLTQHMLIHSGDKPYSCSMCWKRFRRLEHLQIHTRSHTGERPYRCGFCDRAFSGKSSLMKHVKLHTGS